MQKEELRFSVFQIIIDDAVVNFDSFKILEEEDRDVLQIKKEVISIEKFQKVEKENRFVCFLYQEAEKLPYPDRVIDTKKLDYPESKNPRPKDKIELNDKLFVVVDCLTSRIYVSSQREKEKFRIWLQKKIGKAVILKPLINENEFVSQIEQIKEISFTVEPSLLSTAGTLSSALVEEIYGYGAKYATLTLSYKGKKTTPAIISKMKRVLEQKNTFKSLTIVGKTADEFESIFNTSEIVKRMTILVSPSEATGKFLPDSVFKALIREVKKYE